MGGGKSTATLFFEQEGYRKIDSDALMRDRVLTDPEVVAAIGRRFPDAVDEAGCVRRAVLAGHVFADDEARLWLEDLTHPRLFALWREMLAAAPGARWVVEVPLLFEKGLENWFDFIVCVATSSRNQLARLKERGIPQSLAEQRISKQLPLALKLEKSDFVLSNDGTSEALRLQVARLAGILADRL